MKNNQKGITLVALVITIIVLLILAGVTIASLTGNNGLMTKGTKAVDENAIGKAKEQVTNSFNTAMAELYDVKFVSNTLGTKTAQDFIMEQLNDDKNFTDVAEIKKDGTTYTITLTGVSAPNSDGLYKDKPITCNVLKQGNSAKLGDWSYPKKAE